MSKVSKKAARKALDTLTKKDELERLSKAFKAVALMDSPFLEDPKAIVEKGAKQIQKYFDLGEQDEQTKQDLEKYIRSYSKVRNLDTHVLLSRGVDPEHLPMVLGVIDELTAEYEVKKPQDKAYVQMAALAYSRYISNLDEYNQWKNHEYNSNERVGYMNMVSKDIDRAFRQYNAVINYFEMKKRPPLQVTVKANTAFVAQNQQNLSSSNPLDDEINDPK